MEFVIKNLKIENGKVEDVEVQLMLSVEEVAREKHHIENSLYIDHIQFAEIFAEPFFKAWYNFKKQFNIDEARCVYEAIQDELAGLYHEFKVN